MMKGKKNRSLLMKMHVDIGGKSYRVEFENAASIANAMKFESGQPALFGAGAASREPMVGEGFEGRVENGFGCNVDVLTINPHCNGTHTETVGHIVEEPVFISEAAVTGLFPAGLVTIKPKDASEQQDTYRPELADGDRVISKAQIEQAIKPFCDGPDRTIEALVIRTSPNEKRETRTKILG